jgi:hypothetical protein
MDDVSFLSDINWDQEHVSSAPDDVGDNGSPHSAFFDRLMNNDQDLEGQDFMSDNQVWRVRAGPVGDTVSLNRKRRFDDLEVDQSLEDSILISI